MTLSFLIMKARSVSKPDLPEKPVTVLSEPQRKKRHHAYQLCSRQRMAAKQIVQVEDTKSLMDYGFLFSENTASGSKTLPLPKSR